MSAYTTKPLRVRSLQDLLILSHVLKEILKEPTDLNGYKAGCSEACGLCPDCAQAREAAAALLTHPATWAWELWSKDPLDFVGILLLSKVDPGRDATAHFKFFDGTLRDKTEVLHSWFDWAFAKFDLRRISMEFPGHAFSAMSFASRKLGFGGDFSYRDFKVEGIKRMALGSEGAASDLILMGKTRNASNA